MHAGQLKKRKRESLSLGSFFSCVESGLALETGEEERGTRGHLREALGIKKEEEEGLGLRSSALTK